LEAMVDLWESLGDFKAVHLLKCVGFNKL